MGFPVRGTPLPSAPDISKMIAPSNFGFFNHHSCSSILVSLRTASLILNMNPTETPVGTQSDAVSNELLTLLRAINQKLTVDEAPLETQNDAVSNETPTLLRAIDKKLIANDGSGLSPTPHDANPEPSRPIFRWYENSFESKEQWLGNVVFTEVMLP